MKRLFTFLLAASCLTVVGQVPENVLTDDMVAWYPFDGNANDFSGYSNHGAINGAQLTEDRFGEANGAFSFSGGTNIQIPHNPQIDFATGDSLTWAIWVLCHPDEVGSVFEKWLNSFVPYPPFHIRVNAVQGGAQVSSSGYCGQNGQSAGVSTVIPWNTWTHVAFTSSASHYNYFIDGQLVTSADIPQVGCTNDHPLTIGTRAGASHAHYEGKVDDFGIWGRTFSPEEIETLYSLSSPIEGCTDANACNYNEEAQWEDGSCHFNCQFCHVGTVWDESLFKCVVANPADINFDGCVQLNDLLDLLSAYGNCGAEESAWQCGDPLAYQGYDYATVQIGEQCWFAENLRVEKFNNGDSIPFATDEGNWSSLESALASTYGEGEISLCNNYSDYVEEFDACDEFLSLGQFGLLYNWYATQDEREVCPSGWKIPSNQDWVNFEVAVEDSISGSIGQALMSTELWEGGPGTNALGWDGLPGGCRYSAGHFQWAGRVGFWWSSDNDGNNGYFRRLDYDSDELNQMSSEFGFNSNFGFSVRCIKDSE